MPKNKGLFSIQGLTFTAMLLALQIVLGNLLQVPLLGKQYNLGFLPIAAAGVLLGAPAAMIVGGLGDLLGAHLFPQGAYFPGFTLTNILVGLCCGLVLFRRRPAILRVVIAVTISMLLNWVLNSYWLSMLYSSKTYLGWLAVRGANYLVEIPLNIALVYLVLRLLVRAETALPSFMRLTKEKGER